MRRLCRAKYVATVRCHRLIRPVGVATLISLFMVLVWIPAAGAGTEDTPIRIVADPQRACGNQNLHLTHRLERSKSKAEIRIVARSYWNASGLILEKGVTYRIEVISDQSSGNQCETAGSGRVPIWYDAAWGADGCGWLEQPKQTWLRWFIALTNPLKRAPEKPLFHLMGALYGKCVDGKTCARHFSIGSGTEFTAPADGEFCSFANDIPLLYGNNSGSIDLLVTRK